MAQASTFVSVFRSPSVNKRGITVFWPVVSFLAVWLLVTFTLFVTVGDVPRTSFG